MENKQIVKKENILFLFDVDGTLSLSREKITSKMLGMLKKLKQRVNIAFVGGSDLCKQVEQIGDNVLDLFDYGFPENGLQYYKNGNLQTSESILEFLGEKNYQEVVNLVLKLFSQTVLPKKRGVFIEMRHSMINISPIGRSCSQKERAEFFEYDKANSLRKRICELLNEDFKKYGLCCVIGGQISIDIFPMGWDKTYALKHITEEKIYFFGDMIEIGGNDYEIYMHPRVHGVSVTSPDDTFEKVNEKLNELGIETVEE